MIHDLLPQANLYHPVHPRFAAAFDYLTQTDFSRVADGRYELDPAHEGDVFALVQRYSTRRVEDCFWESHRRHIDIQCVVAGLERIGVATTDRMTCVADYDPSKDMAKWRPNQPVPGPGGSFVTLPAGGFAVLFPHDAHMPMVAVNDPESVTKVVIKVRVQGV